VTIAAPPPDLSQRLARTRLLVIGDLMLDCYCWGDVRRISPEAPVPVVKVNARTYSLGGAGNVAANLSGLGCRVALVALSGTDAAADRVRSLLADAAIDDHCIAAADRPTTTKTRVMAGKQQVARLDEEAGGRIDARLEDRIAVAADEMVADVQAVVVSDYGKGMFAATEMIQAIIGVTRKKGIPIFVDPKGKRWERYAGASCVTPNTAELELVAGQPLGGDVDLTPVAGDLCRRLSLDRLLVTRGAQGMSLFSPDGPALTIAARAREVFDVSGAGDTVIATLAACVAAGMTVDAAAAVSNAAAGIVVGKLGTQPVRWPELALALADMQAPRPDATAWKVADIDAAAARVAAWRQDRQQIVFTNGCFDLLHPGHVSLLHQARALGDRLVVGLNTDASIRRLKGRQRPILAGRDRGAILSALADVDLVVFFDEDTPLDLITVLKPDVLVKGADYRIAEVVGKAVVESYGGQVRLVEILNGYSTTAIARKLADRPGASG
jgi:D-beta-D-heptose 7-phosphate kinase/D-beta-D-heptose 1-phosphate adenosyltransferase